MSGKADLYLYALVAADPTRDPAVGLGTGLAGEPLRAVACAPGLFALVGEVAECPRPSREMLAAHDATVRRLAGLLSALLPARFGETTPGEEALRALIAPRAGKLAPALALVEGGAQMTLRVFAAGTSAPLGSSEEPAPFPDDFGPGARYLAERRRLQTRRTSLPEVAALREALRPLLRAERVERHDTEPAAGGGRLVATAYDLVAREQVAAYRATLARESDRLAGYRVAASGPWPPYAFAPEVG